MGRIFAVSYSAPTFSFWGIIPHYKNIFSSVCWRFQSVRFPSSGRCPSYKEFGYSKLTEKRQGQGVRLIEVSVKRELTEGMETSLGSGASYPEFRKMSKIGKIEGSRNRDSTVITKDCATQGQTRFSNSHHCHQPMGTFLTCVACSVFTISSSCLNVR